MRYSCVFTNKIRKTIVFSRDVMYNTEKMDRYAQTIRSEEKDNLIRSGGIIRMKHTIFRTAAAAALIGTMMLTGCGGSDKGDAVSVQSVSELATRNVSGTNNFSGVVEARSVQKVKKSSRKKIKKCYVSEGDTVKKGELLFTYDTESIELDIQSAELELEELESNIKSYDTQIAELEKERKNASSSDKLSYSLEIQSAQIDKAEAQYNLKSKQQSYEKLKKSMNTTKVYSKISGVVQSIKDTDSDSDTGDEDSSGVYMTILQTNSYRVRAKANEMNVNTLQEGMLVTVVSRLNSSDTWTGTISKIDTDGAADSDSTDEEQAYDSDTGGESATQYEFLVKLDDSSGLLMGQHVYVTTGEVVSPEEANALQLSAAFLSQDEEGNFFVWAEGSRDRLEKRTVTVGTYNEFNDTYAILDGLTEEDYIAFPDEGLEEGMKTSEYQDVESENEELPEYEKGDIPSMPVGEEVPVG